MDEFEDDRCGNWDRIRVYLQRYERIAYNRIIRRDVLSILTKTTGAVTTALLVRATLYLINVHYNKFGIRLECMVLSSVCTSVGCSYLNLGKYISSCVACLLVISSFFVRSVDAGSILTSQINHLVQTVTWYRCDWLCSSSERCGEHSVIVFCCNL